MKTLWFRCFVLLGLLVAIAPARAAYNPAIVSADARWVVYADLNGLRASALGKELIAAVEAAQKKETGGMIGIDVPKLLATVGSLTAYGTNFESDPSKVDGALIAQGTPDLRKIAESLLLQGTLTQPKVFSEVTDLPYPAYAIADPNAKSTDKTQLVVAFPPEPIVLVSKSKAHLQKARDAFRGTAPSLAKGPASLLTKLPAKAEGSFLFVATLVPTEHAFPQNAPQARILQLTNSASMALGERGANVFTHAELLASSDSNAERLMKILQGLTAMVGLAETNDKQLGEFLNSIEVAREKNTVTLDLAYSSVRLAQMVQTMRREAEATPAPRRQQQITIGRVVEEWGGEGVPMASPAEASQAVTRTIENVTLANGSLVTVGRLMNGGRNAKLVSLEAAPVAGGAPLVFKPDFMRNIRGVMQQLQFPGADGAYNLRLTYLPDPEGKAKFAVSVSEPKAPEEKKSK